jgi:biopolymer transport protein ExbD
MKLEISSKRISTTVLISMTDVIFLLLLFLLIASNFSSQTGISVRLPGSSSGQRQAHQVLHIVYNSDSDVVFKNVRYNINTLGLALKREFAGKEQAVRLSANKDTPLQEVVTLMDVVRNAGFEKIFISTEAAKDKRK